MKELWQYSTIHNSSCKVIDEETLWGKTVCRIWLPNNESIVKVPKETLCQISEKNLSDNESHRISYIASATKVADVLESSINSNDGHILLSPMEANVIPLPHQIHALTRAVSGDQIRYLLADEVGLGKTIEAGLIMRELKLRGLVRRVLIILPKGLATQWVCEMQTHFNEQFQLIFGEDLKTIRKIIPSSQDHDNSADPYNPWHLFNQIVVSLDSVKPLDKRRGWSKDRIDEYNRTRFDNLLAAGWDLIIVDESHRLGGSTDQVARYKLGQGLAEAAPYLLLLSATPHQGKTDAFHRLISLLDKEAFPDPESVSCDRVKPYVIRTEKRKTIDAEGKPLFKPRKTQMIPICWKEHHHLQQVLYEAITDYVREGYNQALREKKRHIGFLMVLMQRLVISSTCAIRTMLENRLDIIKSDENIISNRLEGICNTTDDLEEYYDMDGQELLDELLKSHIEALQNESMHIDMLLDLAQKAEQAGADSKAESLLEWIYILQSEEKESDLKLIVFTEFIATQKMLKDFLEQRGFYVACLNGSMDIEQRRQAQETFRNKADILISTDAGGEGLNLQFCHVVINYDIPWNPMRIEQRIGRVDRIGQEKIVRAINFVFEDSVEFRVREVLEEKLSIIFEEFGIDKTGDVLDSAQAGELFENVFVSAIANPDAINQSVDNTIKHIKEEIIESRKESSIYDISEDPDISSIYQIKNHPLPYWVERMTTSYILSHGGQATHKKGYWDLIWPDGTQNKKVVFNTYNANKQNNLVLLSLEDSKVRNLASNLPQIIPYENLVSISLKGLPENISGYWGLYEIRLQSGLNSQYQFLRIPTFRKRFLCVFVTEEGKVFLPTARFIWDSIINNEPQCLKMLSSDESFEAFDLLQDVAEKSGYNLFNELVHQQSDAISKEKERFEYYFTSQKKLIDRIGLPEVRRFRFNKLSEEETKWHQELKLANQALPEIKPLLLLRVLEGDIHE